MAKVFFDNSGPISLIQLLNLKFEMKIDVQILILQIINQISEYGQEFQNWICSFGVLPMIFKLGYPGNDNKLRVEAAYFIGQIVKHQNKNGIW